MRDVWEQIKDTTIGLAKNALDVRVGRYLWDKEWKRLTELALEHVVGHLERQERCALYLRPLWAKDTGHGTIKF